MPKKLEDYIYYKDPDCDITVMLGDCLEIIPLFENKSFDLVVTSPPYDDLRGYDNEFDFYKLSAELLRIEKQGGVLVWVVGDSVKKNSETGTSFRQALGFKEIGFSLHDTMIYQKNSYPFPMSNRYYQVFEYMFILSKGIPKTTNLLKQENIWKQKNKTSSTTRRKDGTTTHLKYETGKEKRTRDNVWKYNCGFMRSTKDKVAYEHPAIFPDQLAKDHMLSWSNSNDLILDPFLGSGTTLVACKELKRRGVGIEISEKYCEIAAKRLKNTIVPMF